MRPQLEDLLFEWEERHDRGETPTPAELCPDWPEGQAELARLIGALQKCNRLMDLSGDEEAIPPEPVFVFSIPGYELLGELGRGGMGIVYKVLDPILSRASALKMVLLAGFPLPPEERERLTRRFIQEAKVLAQLKHPNIVPIYEARVHDGRPYFVMEWLPGGSLAAHQAEMTAAGPSRIVPFMEKVARAVHFAHGKGVLHRDLKPGNILLDHEGQPLVSDFGLARILGADADPVADGVPPERQISSGTGMEWSRLTTPGVQPGTPAYMAPEQFDPSLGPIGPATDVWALGVLLYELLTGDRPFRARTRDELKAQVCSEPPQPPRALRPTLDRRVENVVLRCLEKDPARRFASAGDLADALAQVGRQSAWRRWTMVSVVGLAALAGGWLGFREMDPERRYQRQVAPLVKRLAHGEELELITPGGAIPAYQVRCGGAATTVQMTEEGLAITTPVVGLVEFLPEVPWPSFRIEVQMRHDHQKFRNNREEDIGVGLVWRDRRAPASRGESHLFELVQFNDYYEAPSVLPQMGPATCRATTGLLWFVDLRADGVEQGPVHRYKAAKDGTARYAPDSPGAWRTFQVEVTAKGTTAILLEASPQIMGPFLPEEVGPFRTIVARMDEEASKINFDPDDQPLLSILVIGGKCTIRRLRIVPDPQANH